MRTRESPSNNYPDALNGKPMYSRLHANWESLYVPGYRWQPRLAISLTPDAFSTTRDESMLYKIPIFYKSAIFFVDPITRQTCPDAQVQNCSDRIKNLFHIDMEDENSWFTITPTLEHRKRRAVFGPKDVTPVSRRAFGGAGDAGIYTRAQLSEFWYNIFISAARKALHNFTRTHCPQHRNSWTRTIFLLYPANRLLCRQHDFPHLLQKSVYGHVWISCICLVEFISLASCLSSSSLIS